MWQKATTVLYVTKLLLPLVVLDYTRPDIQESGLSNAPMSHAVKHSMKRGILKHTLEHIRRKSHTHVRYVELVSVHKVN